MSEVPASAVAVAESLRRRSQEAAAFNLILTPAGRAAAERERREADRAALLPPPREVLRAAHAERAAAQIEADRLTAAAERASEHLAAATAERGEQATAIEQAEAIAAQQLIEQLTGGGRPPESPGTGGELRVALADADHQLVVAQRAADAVGAELDTARKRLATTNRHVREAVATLLRELARNEADAILADADALDRRRAALDALGIELTMLERQLGAARPAAWPQSISEALHPELRDPPRLPSRHAGTAPEQCRHWAAVRKALLEDAAAYAELDSDRESETVAEPAPAK
jgi:hypothetical protein